MNKINIIFILIIILSGILVVNASNTEIATVNTRVTVINIIPPPTNETSISGYVLNDINKSGLPGWTIDIIGIIGNINKGKSIKVITQRSITNSNGLYKFSNLSEGRYFIILNNKPNYIPIKNTLIQLLLKENQKSENNNFTVLNIFDMLNSRPNRHIEQFLH